MCVVSTNFAATPPIRLESGFSGEWLRDTQFLSIQQRQGLNESLAKFRALHDFSLVVILIKLPDDITLTAWSQRNIVLNTKEAFLVVAPKQSDAIFLFSEDANNIMFNKAHLKAIINDICIKKLAIGHVYEAVNQTVQALYGMFDQEVWQNAAPLNSSLKLSLKQLTWGTLFLLVVFCLMWRGQLRRV